MLLNVLISQTLPAFPLRRQAFHCIAQWQYFASEMYRCLVHLVAFSRCPWFSQPNFRVWQNRVRHLANFFVYFPHTLEQTYTIFHKWGLFLFLPEHEPGLTPGAEAFLSNTASVWQRGLGKTNNRATSKPSYHCKMALVLIQHSPGCWKPVTVFQGSDRVSCGRACLFSRRFCEGTEAAF